MSQAPPPSSAPPPQPPPAAGGSGGGPLGKIRSPWAPSLLSIVTLGIYYLVYQFKVFRENQDYSGEGMGPGLALLFAFFCSIVNTFVLPAEVGNLYEREGKDKPVSALTAFWNLIPIIGYFIYWFKVQGRLNDYWESKGQTRE